MAPLTPHVIVMKDHPHYFTKYEGKETKISIFKLFSDSRKIWKCNLSFSKIPISRLFFLWIGKNLETYTAPDQHFKIQMLNLWMSWENLCPNLTFTVESKMGNSNKRGWPHFKLNINDWDISFPKILRIYQWIGKNIFHWGKCNEPTKLIRNVLDWRLKYRS